MVFYHQVKHFLNFFFLFTAMSQFYEPIRIGLFVPRMMPACIILFISYLRELWDEIQRSIRDKAINKELFASIKKKADEGRLDQGRKPRY
jgi:phospholipid-translocating ATPase